MGAPMGRGTDTDAQILRPSDLTIDADRVWRRMGYADTSSVPGILVESFDRAFRTGQDLLDPAIRWTVRRLQGAPQPDGSVHVNDVTFCSNELVVRCQGAEELVLFIATIGPRLEEQVHGRISNEPLPAVVLDYFGSEAVVGLTHYMREELEAYAQPKGYRVGWRFCPGYGDWDTREQHKLFSVLDGDPIGVELAPSGMMHPRKSYAGVVPVGPNVEEISHYARVSDH